MPTTIDEDPIGIEDESSQFALPVPSKILPLLWRELPPRRFLRPRIAIEMLLVHWDGASSAIASGCRRWATDGLAASSAVAPASHPHRVGGYMAQELPTVEHCDAVEVDPTGNLGSTGRTRASDNRSLRDRGLCGPSDRGRVRALSVVPTPPSDTNELPGRAWLPRPLGSTGSTGSKAACQQLDGRIPGFDQLVA